MQVKVVATKPFRFEARQIEPGESLVVSPVQALALLYAKKARFAGKLTAAPKIDAPQRSARTRRTYKRRDMVPED